MINKTEPFQRQKTNNPKSFKQLTASKPGILKLNAKLKQISEADAASLTVLFSFPINPRPPQKLF